MKSLLALLWLGHILPIFAAPGWVVTSYIDYSYYTIHQYTDIDDTPQLTTRTFAATTETMILNISPTKTFSALSTITTDAGYNHHLTLVEVVVPTDAGALITHDPYANVKNVTNFYVPITYKPATSCKVTWIYITTVRINIPDAVETYLTPLPLTTITSTVLYTYTSPSSTRTAEILTYAEALLNPADIPDDVYSSISSDNKPYQIAYCSSPTKTTTSIKATSTFSSDVSVCKYF